MLCSCGQEHWRGHLFRGVLVEQMLDDAETEFERCSGATARWPGTQTKTKPEIFNQLKKKKKLSVQDSYLVMRWPERSMQSGIFRVDKVRTKHDMFEYVTANQKQREAYRR
jgi:hypothetical protein